MKYLGKKFLTILRFLLILNLGIYISVSGSKIFVIWVGLEIKMFGVIPIIIISSLDKNMGTNRSIYYFIVQVIGRLLFIIGAINDRRLISCIGLLCKLGLVPFFWWVPNLISRLDWYGVRIITTIQKVPGVIILFKYLNVGLHETILIGGLRLLVGNIGIKFCKKRLKLFIAWSSISNMGVGIILVKIKLLNGVLFIFLYFLTVVGLCYRVRTNRKLIRFFLIIMSGLPPLLGFLAKIILISDLINEISIIRSIFLLIFIIVVQSIGYIKAFINISIFKNIYSKKKKN